MEKQLRARLGAARCALDGKTGEVQAKISRAQMRGVADLVSRDPGLRNMLPEARASLIDVATSASWVESDLLSVLEMLAEPEQKAKEAKKWSMQHFGLAFL